LPESRESEPTASPETRVPPTLPTSRFCSCRQRARAHKRCKRYLGISSKAQPRGNPSRGKASGRLRTGLPGL
jgi:hypothetical protein